MSTKGIADPRSIPEFRGSPSEWAAEMETYLREHLREIHQELDRLHADKADAE